LATGASKDQRISKILELLAEKGPLNKYWICKSLQKLAAEPTILSDVNDLEAHDFIKITNTKQHVRGSKPSRYYDLTSSGVLRLLAELSIPKVRMKRPVTVSHLAVKYSELLPEGFRVWNAFERTGIVDIAEECFFRGITWNGTPDDTNKFTLETKGWEHRSNSVHPLTFFCSEWPFLQGEKRERLLTALRKDPELRRSYSDCLETEKQQRENSVKEIAQEIAVLRSLTHD
jgi:DNA-binding PadR family transcriptional regulator